MTRGREWWGQKALLACLLAGAVSACSVLPKSDPVQVYSLPTPQAQSQNHTAIDEHTVALRVLTPYSNRMLASTRILVRPDDGELSAYKGARWSDAAPVLLRDFLVQALRTDGRMATVSNDNTSVRSDLALGGDLNRFQVEYVNEAPVVHIQWDALMIEPADNRIVASRRFRVTQAVEGKEVAEVVQAFGTASQALASQIIEWLAQQRLDGLAGHKE